MLPERYAITSKTIGFIRAKPEVASRAFIDSQTPVHERLGRRLAAREIDRSFSEAMDELLPLTNLGRTRFAFVPTTSEWTAYFDNGHDGTDAYQTMPALADRLSTSAVGMTCTVSARNPASPVTAMTLYGSGGDGRSNVLRSISCTLRDGRSQYSEEGVALPFEKTAMIDPTSPGKSFTPAMLQRYLEALGIYAFEETFYGNAEIPTVFIQADGPAIPGQMTFYVDEFGQREANTEVMSY